MQCLTPTSIRDPRYLDKNVSLQVPCGKCYRCLTNLRNSWTQRLKDEAHASVSSFFVTLTYEDKFTDGNVSKRDVQLFLKRLRFRLGKTKIRYYCVSEYGTTTYRPHYHMLIFSQDIIYLHHMIELVIFAWSKEKVPLGLTKTYPINDAEIHYCTKHHLQKLENPPGLERTFSLMSTRPGIGFDFASKNFKNYDEFTVNYRLANGFKCSLPRYYKKKFWSDERRAEMAKDWSFTPPIDFSTYLLERPNSSHSEYCDYIKQIIDADEQRRLLILKKTKL